MTRYLEDGDLSIDNNHTERSLRGIAVGRRNWTFVGSDRGGKTMAVLRSFVASCELVKVDPFAWFQDVLSRIGDVLDSTARSNCCRTAGPRPAPSRSSTALPVPWSPVAGVHVMDTKSAPCSTGCSITATY